MPLPRTYAFVDLAAAAVREGDDGEMQRLGAEALALLQVQEALSDLNLALAALAQVRQTQGDAVSAEQQAQQAQGYLDRAQALLETRLAHFRQLRDQCGIPTVLDRLTSILLQRRQGTKAADLARWVRVQ